MKKLTAVLLLVIVFSYQCFSLEDIPKSFDYYLKKELRKKGKSFKKELDKCIKKGIIEPSDEKCLNILHEYEEIKQKAFEAYYEKKLQKAKEVKLKYTVDYYQLENQKFIFLKLFLDSKYEFFTIDSPSFSAFPSCRLSDKYIIIFLHVKNDLQPDKITIFFGKRLQRTPKDLTAFIKEIEKIQLFKTVISLKNKNPVYKDFKAKEQITSNGYNYILPSPVANAYAYLEFLDYKIPFPRYEKNQKYCVKPSILLKNRPDSIYVNMTVEEGYNITDKDFKIW